MTRHRLFCATPVLLLLAVGCTSRVYNIRTDRSLFLKTMPGRHTIYLKTNNTSLLPDFPIDDEIRRQLRAKGYTLSETPEAADVILRVAVRSSTLKEAANTGRGAAGGAAAGGVAGAIGAIAAGGRRSGTALGGLAGAIAGAGLGWWLEERDKKNTLVADVDLQIEEKHSSEIHRNHIYARIRDRNLTQQEAANRMLEDLAKQVAGQF
jgi:outer membrane lipoprotein SlyB